jgi:signal transduction histidine kinase
VSLNPTPPNSDRTSPTSRGRTSLAEAELPDNVSRLIRLRWLAGLGVIVSTLLLDPLLHIEAPTRRLLAVGAFILVYNLFFWLACRTVVIRDSRANTYEWFTIGQMAFDWIATILLIHFSGGIESPAISFFFFHLVIACILFQPRIAAGFCALALVLIYGLAGLEYVSLLPHYSLGGFLQTPLYQNELYTVSVLFFFGFTAAFITYLVTNISDHLNQRVEQVMKLSESLQQATNQLQALNRSARTITSSLELNKVLNLLVQNTAEVMDIRACSIRLLDPSGKQLKPLVVYGLSQAYLNKGPILLENSPLDRQVMEGAIINIPDVSQSVLLQYPEWALQEGFYSMLSAPISGKDKSLGILRAYSEEKNHFKENDERFLAAIAAQGGIAIENAMAYQAVEELEGTKSTFVRTFTHELRSPVGVIHSLLRNLTDGYAGELTSLQRDLLDRALRRTDFLQELIDDLLDLSAGKLQKQPNELQSITVKETLVRVFNRFEIPAKEKGLSLRFENLDPVDSHVLATPEGLDLVFNNLISNAVKYTPSGGSVNITLMRRENEVCVRVEDTGIGIPEAAMSHLFTEFYRASNAKDIQSKGTGLGLAIVRDTVTRFGGSVTVESQEGHGARFDVTLPMAVGQS